MSSAQGASVRVGHLEGLAPVLQEMVDAAATSSGIVGAQVSIISGDSRADLVYGSANLDLQLPMTADTVVQVGSVCKVLNAALTMTLVEEGELSLDTPIMEYLPDFKLADRQARESITLRHLLSMSSGMDNGPYNDYGSGEGALGRYVSSLAEVAHIFAPGRGYGYSNAGSCVAGYVAERVTGKSWDVLMKERIFEPAGLTHALTRAEDLPFHRVSAGHVSAKDGRPAQVIRPWYINQSMGPAGSTLTMSAQDLASFGYIFVNRGKAIHGRRVLSEASVKAMMTPTTDVPVRAPFMAVGPAWGLGPSMDSWSGTTVWGHAGGNRSGVSRVAWFPERRGALAVAFNTSGSNEEFVEKILGDVSGLVFGARAARPTVTDLKLRPDSGFARYVGSYMRYGTRIEITENGGLLRFREFSLGTGKLAEHLGLVYESTLRPHDTDRFICDTPGTGSQPMLSSHASVGFSGDDGQGRATILVSDPILAARRVS